MYIYSINVNMLGCQLIMSTTLLKHLLDPLLKFQFYLDPKYLWIDFFLKEFLAFEAVGPFQSTINRFSNR